MSDALLKKAEQTFTKLAGEPVTIELISGHFYAFGSELATLRLFKAYRYFTGEKNQGYSKNLNSFYFTMESRFDSFNSQKEI